MRGSRNLRQMLVLAGRRGWFRGPVRPGRSALRRNRYISAGGIVSGPRGARSFALQLVRREIMTGTYVTPWRLEDALSRLLAAVL